MGILSRVQLVRALGWRSVWRVARYRIGLKTGMSPVLRLRGHSPAGPFFTAGTASIPAVSPSSRWTSEGLLFGYHRLALADGPPKFDAHPETWITWPGAGDPWWQVPDFGDADIKLVWELSRFPWLAPMAQRIRMREPGSIERVNEWIEAWLRDNPPFTGPNWKCGQEASVRVLNLALAAKITGQASAPQPALLAMVELHLRRVAPTIGYAMGQNNNHGTSEAAALFVGGSWLERFGHPKGKAWARIGRHWLDDRASKLIAEDGSFSQYSTVYHRLVLDTYSLAEIWRRDFKLPPFSDLTGSRLRGAARWLHQMTDPETGAVPNLGPNDGAQLFILSDADYRDFRPSVDRAMVLFEDRRAFPGSQQSANELAWLELPSPAASPPPISSRQYDQGGYAVLQAGAARAILRYPRFTFRPSQSDALHLDLWLGSRNVIRDGGSYSYNAAPELVAYFAGAASHSTIQFDDRDQMSRVSRFLFGDWLSTDRIEPLQSIGDERRIGAGYRDRQGARHFRRMELRPDRLIVKDEIDGFHDHATLRWRLDPSHWVLADGKLSDGICSLTVTADMPIRSMRLTTAEESLYYLEKHVIPVLEIVVTRSGRLTTMVEWTK